MADAPDAAAVAGRHHQPGEDDIGTVGRCVVSGVRAVESPWAYHDLRETASGMVGLAPEQYRQIIRIRLACKRGDRYLRSVEIPGHILITSEVEALDGLNEHVVALVRRLVDRFGTHT